MAAPHANQFGGMQTQPRPFAAPLGTTGQQQGGASQQIGSPTKEVNTSSFCRIGQEMVQDVVHKTQETFNMLRHTELPHGTNVQNHQDKKAKLEELTKNLTSQFKKLRMVYDKVSEDTVALDSRSVEEMLPIEEDGEVKGERPAISESLRYASDEREQVIEQLQLRNQQLKEIIDQLRTIVWEINAMMAMRKS